MGAPSTFEMAGDKALNYQALESPEKFQDVLRRDRGDDCLSCKVVGTAVFLGLGGYSYFSGMSQLEQQKAKILQSNTMFWLAEPEVRHLSYLASLRRDGCLASNKVVLDFYDFHPRVTPDGQGLPAEI